MKTDKVIQQIIECGWEWEKKPAFFCHYVYSVKYRPREILRIKYHSYIYTVHARENRSVIHEHVWVKTINICYRNNKYRKLRIIRKENNFIYSLNRE